MTAPFQPSCHSLHPVPPPRKKRFHPAAPAAGILLAAAALAMAGSYGWSRYCAHVQKKEAEEHKARALLETKAKKDAALLAEIEQKKREAAAAAEQSTQEPAPPSRTEEIRTR